jgi:hypothetical protein
MSKLAKPKKNVQLNEWETIIYEICKKCSKGKNVVFTLTELKQFQDEIKRLTGSQAADVIASTRRILQKLRDYELLYFVSGLGDYILADFTVFNIEKNLCKKRKSRGELMATNFLTEIYVDFEIEKKFQGMNGVKGGELRLDIYFEIWYKGECIMCAIEIDGIQHFIAIKIYGGIEGLKIRQANDKLKNEYCKNNDIELLRIPYTKIEKTARPLELLVDQFIKVSTDKLKEFVKNKNKKK